MASSLLDVCRFNPTLGGTTDWTYSSAVVGYQSPTAAGAVNGAVYSYRAESADLSQWEVGFGAYTSGTGVFARTTVLFNSAGTTAKISFTVAPQVAIVALAEDLLLFNAAMSLTTAQQTQALNNIGANSGAVVSASPSGSGTTSTTGVMMGYGSVCKLTPTYSGRVFLVFSGSCYSTVGPNTCSYQVRYGTGTAPTNGAAVTGTAAGSLVVVTSSTSFQSMAACAAVILTGLTPGTTYWFDLSNTSSSASSTANMAFSFYAMEF